MSFSLCACVPCSNLTLNKNQIKIWVWGGILSTWQLCEGWFCPGWFGPGGGGGGGVRGITPVCPYPALQMRPTLAVDSLKAFFFQSLSASRKKACGIAPKTWHHSCFFGQLSWRVDCYHGIHVGGAEGRGHTTVCRECKNQSVLLLHEFARHETDPKRQ